MTRKTLILTNLNASMKDTLNATLTNEWLFGNQLEDNLKTAKSLEKSSKELKSTPKTAPKRITKASRARSVSRTTDGHQRAAGTKRDHPVSATWVIENGQPKRHTHLEGDTPKPSEYSSWWIERVQKRMGESDNRLYYLVLGPRKQDTIHISTLSKNTTSGTSMVTH